jgi:hypothetical protein
MEGASGSCRTPGNDLLCSDQGSFACDFHSELLDFAPGARCKPTSAGVASEAPSKFEVRYSERVNWRSLYFQQSRRQPGRTGLLRRKSERICDTSHRYHQTDCWQRIAGGGFLRTRNSDVKKQPQSKQSEGAEILFSAQG